MADKENIAGLAINCSAMLILLQETMIGLKTAGRLSEDDLAAIFSRGLEFAARSGGPDTKLAQEALAMAILDMKEAVLGPSGPFGTA